MNRCLPVAYIRDSDERLHRRVHDLLGPKGVLEHPVGRCKSSLHVTTPQLIIQCDVGPLAPF